MFISSLCQAKANAVTFLSFVFQRRFPDDCGKVNFFGPNDAPIVEEMQGLIWYYVSGKTKPLKELRMSIRHQVDCNKQHFFYWHAVYLLKGKKPNCFCIFQAN